MSNKTLFLYAISSLTLIALAGFLPKLAIFIVGLLILGVLVENGSQYATLINSATQGAIK